MMSKTFNEYARAFGPLYARIPKAVFAAVAFSFAGWAAGNEAKDTDQQVERFLAEWRVLHENGIVPQGPGREFSTGKAK
jgi:agmatine/peptidylarginine deiminase